MKVINTNIYTTISNENAFIYLWISKKARAIYVGQTNGNGGVISRAGAHVRSSGTLYLRFYEIYGEPPQNYDDWVLLSFTLPNDSNFTCYDSAYRIAVEYLVQVKLNEIRGKCNPPFRIISNVVYNEFCNYKLINNISNKIVHLFISLYSK